MKTIKLKSASLFGRSLTMLRDEYLVQLQSHGYSDRIRRAPYKDINRVVVQRRLPWISLTLLLCCSTPLLLLAVFENDMPGFLIFYTVLLTLLAGLMARLLWCGKTQISIDRRNMPPITLKCVARAITIERFLTGLVERTDAARRATAPTTI